MKRNILYVFQEITPYLPETPMSIRGRNLPQKIQELGSQIRVFMPRYGCVKDRRNQLHEVIRLSGMNIVVDEMDHSLIIKVASIQSARMQVYFIDNEDYFFRKGIIKDENDVFYEDNDERAIFFARGVLETIKKLRWIPDLVHVNGWLSALIPLYIKRAFREDPIFHDTKVITSIYEDQFEEKFNANMKKKIKNDGFSDSDIKAMERANYIGLMRLAISHSDGVIQASENIIPEVKKFALHHKKPFLAYQPEETFIQAYSDFYDEVMLAEVAAEI